MDRRRIAKDNPALRENLVNFRRNCKGGRADQSARHVLFVKHEELLK